MKIELGCGMKKHDGYIGVDIAENADVRHDLRLPLPFDDNFVDEILVIHVIESFYRWQFPKVLADWYRVLKSGGKISIEFTDLEYSCNMYLGHFGIDHIQHGRWGLHGNQDVEVDPIVLHHYVYERNELIALVKKAGFIMIEIHSQVEHKESRDFTLKASKP